MIIVRVVTRYYSLFALWFSGNENKNGNSGITKKNRSGGIKLNSSPRKFDEEQMDDYRQFNINVARMKVEEDEYEECFGPFEKKRKKKHSASDSHRNM